MSAFFPEDLGKWLLHCVLGGGLMTLLTWWLMHRVHQPAARQRLGELGLAAALVVAVLTWLPAWLVLPWSLGAEQVVHLQAPAEPPEAPDLEALLAVAPAHAPATAVEPPAPAASDSEKAPLWDFSWTDALRAGLLTLYVGVAVVLLGRLLVGYLGLALLLRRSSPAPSAVRELLESRTGCRGWPRLLQSLLLRMPVSCGLWRATIVLPEPLCREPDGEKLGWVLSHELTHLRRHDAWSCLLQGIVTALFFYLPWIWLIRRQIRLCQEYVADAAAIADRERAADYAEFLLNLARPPDLPAVATGVAGSGSDLFRRVTMLLHSPVPVEGSCSRRWLLTWGAALLAVAVVVSGVGLRADGRRVIIIADTPQTKEADKPAKKPQPQSKVIILKKVLKDDRDKDRQGIEIELTVPRVGWGFKQIEGFLRPVPAEFDIKELKLFQGEKDLKNLEKEFEKVLQNLEKIPGFDADKLRKEIRKAIEEAMKNLSKTEEQRQEVLKRAAEVYRHLNLNFRSLGPDNVRTRLGMDLEKPSALIAEQMNLPKDQGLVVTNVKPDSAAAKAGFKVNDIWLELDGKAVPSNPDELQKMLHEIKEEKKAKAVVLRKGKRETLAELVIPAAKNVGSPDFRFFGFGPGRFKFGGEGNIVTTMVRNDDRFTAHYQEGALTIAVEGSVSNGKAKASRIQVRDGKTKNTYESVDQVPERYRERVNQLLSLASSPRAKSEKE